jgi:hypothetical protein
VAAAGDEAQGSLQGPRPGLVVGGPPSTFTAVTARRVLDTRSGDGVRRGRVVPGAPVSLTVRGLRAAQGAVPADATAVVLNLTARDATATTDVRAYPSGGAVPAGSALRAGPRTTVTELVTVPLGPGGAVALASSAPAHLTGDLVGWYAPTGTGAGMAVVDPGRVLDTRLGLGARRGAVGPAGAVDVRVTGAVRTADGGLTVPADARAVILSLTAVAATRTTDVRVYPTPTGTAVPAVTNLDVRARESATNLVIAPVGPGGRVRLRNAAGHVHLVADLVGWYAASAPGRFVPVPASRFLDTRTGLGGAAIPVPAGGSVDLRTAGVRGVPAAATAAVLDVTAVGATATTELQAHRTGLARVPRAGGLPVARGATRSGVVVSRSGPDGRVRLTSTAGQVHLVADLVGYVVR